MLGQKADGHAPFGAEPEQKRAAQNVAEAHDAADGMNGNAETDVAIDFDCYRLTLLER